MLRKLSKYDNLNETLSHLTVLTDTGLLNEQNSFVLMLYWV